MNCICMHMYHILLNRNHLAGTIWLWNIMDYFGFQQNTNHNQKMIAVTLHMDRYFTFFLLLKLVKCTAKPV